MPSLVHLFAVLIAFALFYMSVWFLIGDWARRDDVVDSAWGLGFILVALLSLWVENSYSSAKILALLLTSAWGFRLFWHISVRNSKSKEDFRYKLARSKWTGNKLLQSYLKFYLLNGLLLLVVSAPIIAIMSTTHNFNKALATAGFLIWGFGIIYESIADRQLRNFKTKKSSLALMNTGLWRYSRHPNYFGEIVVWSGAALVALAGRQWWGLVGPIAVAYLILKVSGIPMLERKHETDPEYKKYSQRTSMLIPLPPKKA